MCYRLFWFFIFVFVNTQRAISLDGNTAPNILATPLSSEPNKSHRMKPANSDFFNADVDNLMNAFTELSGILFADFMPVPAQKEKNSNSKEIEIQFQNLTRKLELHLNDRFKVFANTIYNSQSRLLDAKLNAVAQNLADNIKAHIDDAFRKQFIDVLVPLQRTVSDVKSLSSGGNAQNFSAIIENIEGNMSFKNQAALDMLYERINKKLDVVNRNFLLSMQNQRMWLEELSCSSNPVATQLPENCAEALRDNSVQTDGIYALTVPDLAPFHAYCIHDPIDEHMPAWTVIQRRENGEKSFERNWQDYKNGFGDLKNDFWLGLERLHAMTLRKNYELLIELEDWDGVKNYAKYDKFVIGSEKEKYPLSVLGMYNGTHDDSFTYHAGQKFTTKDADNDDRSDGNCAEQFKGGWWYADCHVSNLNGVYNSTEYGVGINWLGWHGYKYSLKHVLMAIRPRK